MKTSILLTFTLAICVLLPRKGATADLKSGSAASTMKAMIVREYGPPEVLKLEDVPRPLPKENEVLVRVIASGVNPVDTLIVSGKYAKEIGTHLPLTQGYDIAGLIEQAGAK